MTRLTAVSVLAASGLLAVAPQAGAAVGPTRVGTVQVSAAAADQSRHMDGTDSSPSSGGSGGGGLGDLLNSVFALVGNLLGGLLGGGSSHDGGGTSSNGGSTSGGGLGSLLGG